MASARACVKPAKSHLGKPGRDVFSIAIVY
jgi:hypothetical protein